MEAREHLLFHYRESIYLLSWIKISKGSVLYLIIQQTKYNMQNTTFSKQFKDNKEQNTDTKYRKPQIYINVNGSQCPQNMPKRPVLSDGTKFVYPLNAIELT